MSGVLVIRMTQKQAEMLGIVICECGHPPNNHFDWDKRSCAHCKCTAYRQRLRIPGNTEETALLAADGDTARLVAEVQRMRTALTKIVEGLESEEDEDFGARVYDIAKEGLGSDTDP